MRVPVHQPLAAVDQPALVERDEGAQDRVVEVALLARRRARRARHREGVAAQVEAVAEPARLLEDRAAGLALPVPDLRREGLAAELAAAGIARLRQLALDDHLRRDAGMVEARLPQHVAALHPPPAGQDVHQRVVERVAHVQRAGDVRRRQQDRERLRARLRVRAGGESAGLLPQRRDPGLLGMRVEGLFHRHGPGPKAGGCGKAGILLAPARTKGKTAARTPERRPAERPADISRLAGPRRGKRYGPAQGTRGGR